MNIQTFQLLARYHAWANQQLIVHLNNVSDSDFFKDQKLFFNSIFGTLNHLLVADHLWLSRFSQGISPSISLNTIIEDDREPLLQKLNHATHQWQVFIQSLDSKILTEMFHYTTTAGKSMQLPYAATLMHVFNHATHHRGQITAAMTALDYAAPELDMIYMLINEQKT